VASILVWLLSLGWSLGTVNLRKEKNGNSTNGTDGLNGTITEYRPHLITQLIGPIFLVFIPVIISLGLSVAILRIVFSHSKALRNLSSSSAERRTNGVYRRKLWRAVLFVLVTTAVSALLVLPYWTAIVVNFFCRCIGREILYRK